LGQSSLVVLCEGSTLLLALTPRARLCLALLPKSASNNLRKWFLFPTGRLNLGIITEGKLTAVLIIPSSWNFPTSLVRHQDFLWRCCRGERISARGVSHFQSFYFVIVLLSFFILFCLHLVYQKYKKSSFFYSCYFCLSILVLLE
jgi:hypothetical protein